jgi:hypothetical protein
MKKFAVLFVVIFTFCVFFVSPVLAGAKWEYKLVNILEVEVVNSAIEKFNQMLGGGQSSEEIEARVKEAKLIIEQRLNKFGAEGWEIVYMDKGGGILFKRELESK